MKLRMLLVYVTCGTCFPVRRTQIVEIPWVWYPPPPHTCKCGTTDPVYEDTDKFRPLFSRICIGYITWIPCPLHPCEHSSLVQTTSASGTGGLTPVMDEMVSGAADALKCLCSKQSQIELDPKLVEQQEYWFQERDKIC